MEDRVIMQILTAEQMVDRFADAYDWIVQYGVDGFLQPPGVTVDDFIAQEYVFFIDVNQNLCCERDGGEFIWDLHSEEWLQGTYTNSQRRV